MTTRCLVTWKISIYNIYANIYVYKMDGERLVEAVRKYEILYVSSQKAQKSYKSNEKKAEAWLKVSEEVEIPGNYFICYVFSIS